MNTINSVYYGWGFLIVAGGGSYYFAKRSINADRAQRAAFDHERRAKQAKELEEAARSEERRARLGDGRDSEWEASGAYRSRKGDRFS